MPGEPREYSEIGNVTKEECFERWEGVSWNAYGDESDRGLCQSDYDFDGWANEHNDGDEEDE